MNTQPPPQKRPYVFYQERPSFTECLPGVTCTGLITDKRIKEPYLFETLLNQDPNTICTYVLTYRYFYDVSLELTL